MSKPARLPDRPIALQLILVIPFVLQILATVGLVGYLSFRNGQKAVNKRNEVYSGNSNQAACSRRSLRAASRSLSFALPKGGWAIDQMPDYAELCFRTPMAQQAAPPGEHIRRQAA